MTQETAHMPLDERGLEAAYETLGMPDHPDQRRPIEPAIRAYLQTAAADVTGLVDPVSMSMFPTKDDMLEHLLRQREEAASTLQTLSASNAALEAENARLREALSPFSVYFKARAALSAPKGGRDHG